MSRVTIVAVQSPLSLEPEPPCCTPNGSGGTVRLIASRLRDHSRLGAAGGTEKCVYFEIVGRNAVGVPGAVRLTAVGWSLVTARRGCGLRGL